MKKNNNEILSKYDKEKLLAAFCSNLIELRREKKLTQKEISEKLGVVESTYANWEQGRREPNIWYLIKLIEIFEIDMNTLFDFLYK